MNPAEVTTRLSKSLDRQRFIKGFFFSTETIPKHFRHLGSLQFSIFHRQMSIIQISHWHQKRRFVFIERMVAEEWPDTSACYIIDYSENFVLLQNINGFKVDGFSIIPLSHVVEVSHCSEAAFIEKVLISEGEKEKVEFDFRLNIDSWPEIFTHLKETRELIAVHLEAPSIFRTYLGKVKVVLQKFLVMSNTQPDGVKGDNAKLSYKTLSRISFGDEFCSVYERHTRF